MHYNNSPIFTKIIIFYVVFLLLVTASSCRKENICDCIKSNGEIITSEREISEFTSINLYNNINLYLHKSDIPSLQIEAGENIIKLIETKITDKTINIRNKNKCNWVRNYDKPINIYLGYTIIEGIKYYGSGDISTSTPISNNSFAIEIHNGSGNISINLETEKSKIWIQSGPSDITITGRSTTNNVYYNGVGSLFFSELTTKNTYITSEGLNNCYIHSTNHIDATTNYLGNIYYTGTPSSIIFNKNNEGELVNNN